MVQMTLPAVAPTRYESDYDDQLASIKRRRLQAQALQNADLGLGPQMVSGHYVASGWLDALGKIAQAGIGSYSQSMLDKEEKALNKQKEDEFTQLAANFPKATPGRAAVRPAVERDDEGNLMPDVEPALLPKKPGSEEYINFAAKLMKYGPAAQGAAQHILQRVVDAELPPKPTGPIKWERGADTTNDKGERVMTWYDPHDPNPASTVRLGSKPVAERESDLSEKRRHVRGMVDLHPATKDMSEREKEIITTQVTSGDIGIGPPNAQGMYSIADKILVAAGNVRNPPPGGVITAGGEPQPARQPASQPAVTPPLVPQPPAQSVASPTPPLIPNVEPNKVLSGIPANVNPSGTAEQKAGMQSAAEADAAALANKRVSQLSPEEKRARYGADSANHPFLPPPPPPYGIRQGGGFEGAKQSEALNTEMKKLGDDRKKQLVPDMEQYLREFHKAARTLEDDESSGVFWNAQTGQWDGKAPGAGIGKFHPWPAHNAQVLQQAKRALDNIIIKMRAGTAVSASEADRLEKELGQAWNQGDDAFWRAAANIEARVKAADAEILRPYAPIVRDAWAETNPNKERRVVKQMRTPDGKLHRLYDDGKEG